MKIRKVLYSALHNLGDYQNERIGLVAHLSEEDDLTQAVQTLRSRVAELTGPRLGDAQNRRWKLLNELEELEYKLKTARENWTRTVDFLVAQGIKQDPPNFPEFTKLLSPAALEEVEVVEAEECDEDDEDDDEDDEDQF